VLRNCGKILKVRAQVLGSAAFAQGDLSTSSVASPTPEDRLWKWFDSQERYTVEQFGIGIVGIGALFFAYTQASFALLKILISLIGLGGSLTLVMHMYGARMTRDAIMAGLRELNGSFSERDNIVKARDEKISWLYFPPGWMMISYMILVSYAWVGLIGYRLSVLFQAGLSDNLRLGVVALVGIILFFFVFYMLVQRKKTCE